MRIYSTHYRVLLPYYYYFVYVAHTYIITYYINY